MTHTRGKPYHPQTQGKIERWHRSLKNRILLENYYLPGELENQIQQFIHYYNHERYHESLNSLTPADVFYGRGNEILKQRQQIKVNTLLMRKQMHYHKRAQTLNPMSQTTPLIRQLKVHIYLATYKVPDYCRTKGSLKCMNRYLAELIYELNF